VWEDPQDERVRVNVAARSQLRKLRQTEVETELTGVWFVLFTSLLCLRVHRSVAGRACWVMSPCCSGFCQPRLDTALPAPCERYRPAV
jgi:hypothetical protein